MRTNLGARSNTAAWSWLAGTVLAMCAFSSTASAQAVYGSIFGTVTDTSGAAIPNASITVTDIAKGTSTTTQTGPTGDYRAEHLIPDSYKVQAAAQGFQSAVANNVVVYADTAPKIDLQLTVGGTSTTVEVTTAAPLLETDRADVSTVLNARAVEQLPNLNRNFTAFELLTPGTTYIGWSVGQSNNPQESEQIEVNGQLPFATGYQLDGTDNQDPIYGVAVINPNLDGISEMKVTSQNYDAELGNAVAGMVTAQTKSGSNSVHGSAFEYRRSDAQQARDPFSQSIRNSSSGRYIPSTLHNQFGGAVGLPVIKNKIFAFGDYQGLREKTGTSVLTTVPTALTKSSCTSGGDCNLSDYLNPSLGGSPQYQAYDPETNISGVTGRTPFPNNIIPVGRLSAPAINLMKLLPAPNNGSAIFNNYQGFGSGAFNTNQFDVRIDDQISQKFHSFGRYTRFSSTLSGAAIFGAAGGAGLGAGGFAGANNSLHQSVAAGGDIAVSSRWATDFRFGWYRVAVNSEGPNYNTAAGTALGIGNINQGNLALTGGLPLFEVAVPSNGQNGGAVINYGTTTNPVVQQESQFQGVNNWTRSLGTHTVRFGADIRYALNHAVVVQNNNLLSGQFDFSAATTAGTTSSVATSASQGLGFATFVLGDISNFYQGEYANLNAGERQRRWFFYGQDQWRATHRLTFNYGLRWELLFPESVNGKGNGGLLDLQSGNVRIAGYGPWNNSLNVAMDYMHLAPRIGVAWQVMPNTVLRAGYGRTYGQGWSGDTFGDVLTYSYPTAVTQNITPANSNYHDSFTLSQGPPTYTFPPIPSSGNYLLPNGISLSTRPLMMRIPTLDAWNLTLQQQFTRSLALQIGYVGSHGIHNMFDSSNQANVNQQTLAGFNQINPSTGKVYTLCDREPYCNGTAQSQLGVKFGAAHQWQQSFRYNANQASTKYNALQVVLEQRFAHGLQFQGNYTWSQARANESDYFFMSSRADYGNGYYNRRHVFSANANYDLPFGHNQMFGANSPGWVNELVGGFSMNAIVTAETGLPFTPSYAECGADEDIDGPGGTLCRPNLATVGGFDPHKSAIHIVPGTNSNYIQFFTPVPAMKVNGGVYGPFQRPAPDTFGDIERDAFYLPGLWDVDFSAAKRFALTERVGLQFTAQAFNVFNHVNPGGVSNQVDVPSGGIIASSASAQIGTSLRALQFAARVQF
ncbi:MAG TPA: TonB-dependent receptor [Acidobacteriaceae bacterium]|nr:TonB-dependent receptor [Acidobacteriaceae bacterium]